jgi:O-antigen ligase
MAYLLSTRHKGTLALFIMVLLIPASLTESRATRMALIFGLATTAIAFLAPMLTRRLLVALLIALLAFPFGITELFLHKQSWVTHLPPSWHHRVEIWDYMSYRIFERPVLGWGIGSSQFLPYTQPHGEMYQYVKMNAPHPHNALIQLWVELGLPGLVLGYVFALALLHKASQLPAKIAPFALGAWSACLCISLVAYNFWSDSLFATFALTALAFTLLKQPTRNA